LDGLLRPDFECKSFDLFFEVYIPHSASDAHGCVLQRAEEPGEVEQVLCGLCLHEEFDETRDVDGACDDDLIVYFGGGEAVLCMRGE
jgi:hypothetical protein